MGYDLHITRAENWTENEDQWITSDEWLSVVESDRELTLNTINGPFFTDWSVESRYESPWFDWSEGNIFTKNPDKKIIEKMLQLADRLNAQVQGDDGEIYRNINDIPDRDVQNESRIEQSLSYLVRDKIWSFISILIIILVIVAINILDIW